MSKFILPEIWYLELETRELFDELCLPYEPDYNFYPYIGITNDETQSPSLGKYYYIDNVLHSVGKRISYWQFKQYVLKEKSENYKYLIKLFKKLNIK